jgi:hypothetical protein
VRPTLPSPRATKTPSATPTPESGSLICDERAVLDATNRARDAGCPELRTAAQGYEAPVAEKIARGLLSGKAAVTRWMSDADERVLITDCGYKAVGIGATSTVLTVWMTQVLGRS